MEFPGLWRLWICRWLLLLQEHGREMQSLNSLFNSSSPPPHQIPIPLQNHQQIQINNDDTFQQQVGFREACTDEYEKLVFRMSTPRVVIDNAVSSNSTIVKFDSARKHGILLEAVQILSDLNLFIKKAYVSFDGRWFMDVFHVTDQDGNKLTNESVLKYIEQSLGSIHNGKTNHRNGLTALELKDIDRVGLLSEVFAVLAEFQCDVVEAKVWTHNGRTDSLIYVKDCMSGTSIEDSEKINRLEARLRYVLQGDSDIRSEKISISDVVIHPARRLHQMMFADRDYQKSPIFKFTSETPLVTVQNWTERSYSVVNVQCKDRAKLLFDVVCNLTDMEYVVFHVTINTRIDQAYMEAYGGFSSALVWLLVVHNAQREVRERHHYYIDCIVAIYVGLVKLMGRRTGHIALHATLSSRDVDYCLIPELDFYLEGKGGLLEFLDQRLTENGHVVLVVAEGAGQDIIPRTESQKESS